MFMPMNILDHDILNSNWTKFERDYCIKSKYNKHIIVGYKHLDILKKLVDPHIISKNREDCLDLPKRIFVRRYYDYSCEMCDWYNTIAAEDKIVINGCEVNTNMILLKLAKCMQVLSGFIYYYERSEDCNSCKHVVDCVKQDIHPGSDGCQQEDAVKSIRHVYTLLDNPKLRLLEEDLDDSNEKTIIWAWYAEDIEAIKRVLVRKKIPFICADEDECAKRFEQDPNVRVFLGQTVQGIGITLNSATCTIYYSHGAALEPRLQSMDRNYRIGQKKPVVVKDYLCRDTVEEMLVHLLAHKTDVKKFMQESITCFTCENMLNCQENNIGYLKKGCRYFGKRMNAETVRTLKIRKLLCDTPCHEDI